MLPQLDSLNVQPLIARRHIPPAALSTVANLSPFLGPGDVAAGFFSWACCLYTSQLLFIGCQEWEQEVKGRGDFMSHTSAASWPYVLWVQPVSWFTFLGPLHTSQS